MSVAGADAAQLDTTARMFTRAADRLDAVSTDVRARLSRHAWTGPDADRFRTDWSTNSAAIRAAATMLRDAAASLKRNASEQRQASAASTGALAGARSGANPQAPSSAAALYDRLRHVTASTTTERDGVFVEQVRGSGDKMRAIVYLGGTELFSGSNQPLLDNAPDYFLGQVKQSQIDAINAALKARNLPADTPLMLAGFSQGGMDAQLLAQSGKLHGEVAAVVTYGSPIVSNPSAGFQTVHLQDAGDAVPKLTQPLPGVANALHGNVFVGVSDSDIAVAAASMQGPVGMVVAGLAAHGDPRTYQQVGNQFDSSAGYQQQKAAIGAFHGEVVPG